MSVKMNVIRKVLKLKKDSDIKKHNNQSVTSIYDVLKMSFNSRDTFKVIKSIALKEMIVKKTEIANVNCLDIKPNFKLKYFNGTPRNPYHLFLYIHGGGFVGGFKEQGSYLIKAMAHRIGCGAIAVEYSLSPEAIFPEALNQIVNVYKEIIKTYNPQNIILGGESAGGNLCMALMLKLKELNLPQPKVAVISSAYLDLENLGESYTANEQTDYSLSNTQMPYMSSAYILGKEELSGSERELLKNPLVSPIYGNYENLPPIFFSACTDELLFTDTLTAYNNCLRDGVKCELFTAEKCFHAYLIMGDFFEESKIASNKMVEFIAPILGIKNYRLIPLSNSKKNSKKQTT